MKSSFKKFTPVKHSQRGIMLLEGLIAILIFSFGILALVGMQAITVNHSGQTGYRLEASFLANKLIGKLWAETNARITLYENTKSEYISWFQPELDAHLPRNRSSATVTITPFAATTGINDFGAPIAVTGYNVNIQIQWRGPNEDISVPAHSYAVTTTIVRNP